MPLIRVLYNDTLYEVGDEVVFIKTAPIRTTYWYGKCPARITGMYTLDLERVGSDASPYAVIINGTDHYNLCWVAGKAIQKSKQLNLFEET